MIVHGIDFSGGAGPWKAKAARPTVWIATLETRDAHLRLAALRPVQHLPGEGRPFDRLVAFLARGDYAAAGIDAPFSLPVRHLPDGLHRRLLDAVGAMPEAEDRPFPRGAALMAVAERVAPFEQPKPLRRCERVWGSGARSTLWNGRARPGAPFAVACLTLLARARRPIWPWSGAGDGMLVEVFPAAQLRQWRWACPGYGRPDGVGVRRTLVSMLAERLDGSACDLDLMRTCPDALDAVLAAFGARAAVGGDLARAPDDGPFREEGWIAVHR